MTTEAKTKTKARKFRNSISLKLIIVTMLSLLLLIPSFMVKQLIKEREQRKNETIRELTSKWGGHQVVSGPVLMLPYEIIVKHADGKKSIEKEFFHILPSELSIDGNIIVENRHRGIYTVLLYSGDYTISGSFLSTDFKDWPEKYDKILWDEAKLVLGISDTKGITKTVEMNWNTKLKKFSPGKSSCNLFNSGINAKVTVEPNQKNEFTINLLLNGSESAFFAVLGNQNKVSLTSNWHTPKFDGYYITKENKVGDDGFTALWETTEMSRNLPQISRIEYRGIDFTMQTVGVDFLQPVATYQKSYRSVKYAFLFIALTFLIIFFAEITGKIRVHPVQYLIIGIALVIFYSLLIALAEHLTFNISFLIASLVILTLTTFYTHALFRRWKNTATVGGFLTLLYGYLFTILQVADYALIIGNIGLVLILGLVMIFSRRVDWYGSQNQEEVAQ